MKETTKRINLISGPRNISTALMYSFANREDTEVVDELVTHLHKSEPVEEGGKIYYPGERTLLTRKENQARGIPVDDGIWQQIQEL